MEEEIEVWKEFSDCERRMYYVSNFGQVKSITKGKKGGKEKILKGRQSGKGYLSVRINEKNMPIHTLVAYAFLGSRPEGLEIDHIDRNKLNNRANNLRYVTSSENKQNTFSYRTDILETDTQERLKIRRKLNARKYRENKKKITYNK